MIQQGQDRFIGPSSVVRGESDLTRIHRDFMSWGDGHLTGIERELVMTFWRSLQSGVMSPFDPSRFFEAERKLQGDIRPQVAEQLMIIHALSVEDGFRHRVPVTVWNALACIAVQTEQSESDLPTIRGREDLLLPWREVDVVLHAIAKPYDFFLHLQSRFSERGYLLSHFGECGCCIRQAKQGAVQAYLEPHLAVAATQALYKHLHAEAKLLIGDELPHAASSVI